MNNTTDDSRDPTDQDDSVVELGVASQSTRGFAWGRALDGLDGYWG